MRRSLAVLAATVTVVATVSVGVGAVSAQTGGTGFTTSYQTIPGQGGTPLKAFVITPNASGPHPLLVMPSSWGMPDAEYVGTAWKLAQSGGYDVISYTSRGFYDSGGTIDVAGPDTQADVSKVIDWGLAHTPSDPDEIGVAGISYGAGLGLLSAAQDPRIKAVSAMSGWGDLTKSLYPNKTINIQALLSLLGLAHVSGRLGPEMQKAESLYFGGHADEAAAYLTRLMPQRSPETKIAKINANHPAIMLANSFQDSIFPPGQLTDFYRKLTGPKRLMLQPGDHATSEAPGLFGVPNDAWAATARWFDHYLRGADNGVDAENPVQLKASNGGGWLGFPSWQAVEGRAQRYYLSGDGGLAPSASTGWQDRINAGVPTPADSGTAFLTGALQGYAQIPNAVAMPLVSRLFAGVWNGPAFPTATTVRGAPSLHTTVTPSSPDVSLFAYLYDVGPGGLGSLITHKPYTLRGATPGKAQPLDITLDPDVWNVPAGHHLAVVIDTVDPRYQGVSKVGTTVVFSSPAADPSRFAVTTG